MNDSNVKELDEKFCSECGAIIKLKAEICPKCGIRQMNAPLLLNLGAVAPNGRSRIVAALLAFFLGSFGVHKFYLGQIGMGVLYLLFFWTFIPTVISFIEFILLLIMSNKTFNQRFGQE